MKTDQIKNETVKKAIDALQSADKEAWFALFTTDVRLYDDGNETDFKQFSENAMGHEYFTSIDRVEDSGLAVYGKFHSDRWGDFKTYFRFKLNEDGKISRLNIGQANY